MSRGFCCKGALTHRYAGRTKLALLWYGLWRNELGGDPKLWGGRSSWAMKVTIRSVVAAKVVHRDPPVENHLPMEADRDVDQSTFDGARLLESPA